LQPNPGFLVFHIRADKDCGIMMMDEAKLIEKLRLIEALFSGAKTEGEKDAADRARQRILDRLKTIEEADPPVEFKFTMQDLWQKKVFIALLRRYGIKPYRYRGQRYTTVMARVPNRFVNETLWPEFTEISRTLRNYLSEVTERIVSQVICQDNSEADIVEDTPQLPAAIDINDAIHANNQ
jgi:hypothetical protein